jgi:hypothetical protein
MPSWAPGALSREMSPQALRLSATLRAKDEAAFGRRAYLAALQAGVCLCGLESGGWTSASGAKRPAYPAPKVAGSGPSSSILP